MSIQSMTNSSKALVGMAFVVGLGLVVLGKFKLVTGIGSDAQTALGAFITGIDDFADWIGIIVLVIVGVYLMAKFAINK